MLIYAHLFLLALALAIPVAVLFFQRGAVRRSGRQIFFALAPFLLIGVLSTLLLNIRGIPTVEWLLPTVALALVALFCVSDRVFKVTWFALLLLTLALCLNFVALVRDDYAADTRRLVQMADDHTDAVKAACRDALRTQFAPDTPLDEAPVSKIFNNPRSFGELEVLRVFPQWHTPVTRLYRVKREKAVLWYPGGEVKSASERLELRRADAS